LSLHTCRLLMATDSTVVAGTTGNPRADADVVTSLFRLGCSAPPALEARTPVAAGRTHILTASDADDEVRAAVRAVIDAVRGGTALDRIAVLHASPEPYARLAYEQLGAAG